MPDRRFFEHTGPVSAAELARSCGLDCSDPRAETLMIETAAPLSQAGPPAVSFFSDKRYLADLRATGAGAVFVPEAFAAAVPATTLALATREPQAAWARVAARLHPVRRVDSDSFVDASARLEDGVVIAPGAVVGAEARVGARTRIGPNAVIGCGVSIGRDCVIGPNVTVEFALVGDRVTLAAGVVIGSAGFGVAGSAAGAQDVPQLGRVIIQDGVSIGANSCVDRGAYDDTVLGENTKIDNLVQIAHGVVMGRNCVVAAQGGISGSVTVGDGAMFGGGVGIADHLTIGAGARLAGGAGLMHDVPPGETWAGLPARPIRQWLRETAWLAKQSGSR